MNQMEINSTIIFFSILIGMATMLILQILHRWLFKK